MVPAPRRPVSPGLPARTAVVQVCPERPGTLVVTVSGEIDLASVAELDEALRYAVEVADEVLVDLSGVTFFAVAGVNSLLDAQALRRARLSVHLGGSGPARRVFTLVPIALPVTDPAASRP